MLETEGEDIMGHKLTPRYYIRDSETNELWCFDSRLLAG